MPIVAPAPSLPFSARLAAPVAALMVALQACTPLPDTGRDVARLGPVPPLVPIDGLLAAPEPEATAESAAALAARGAALKAEAATLE